MEYIINIMNITTDAENGGPWEWRPDTSIIGLHFHL